ncbi:MAG: flagellar biosynthesis protein FlhA [Immundisolibacteraceae bacterium]|nr:flagellar biosynthesis protein FlhA [Immundisolibacteraceae bacterium]
MNLLQRVLGVGIGIPLMLMLMLSMLILPLPAWLLDLLFTFNISLAVVVLLVALYIKRPLDFAAFPTVILVATLLRLGLNVASTRIVLLEGHAGGDAAGQVIKAFGDFVVGGNYAVGLVVFVILVLINFVVITKGAGRIAEVSARFTLDALPGKQMAIDADLNAGVIDQDEAKDRREYMSREADFYGAMDGASKFVRGDTIAGVLITFINILGGFAIGMLQHDLSGAEAARNYTLLTIGDGLAAQIPALLLSTATAMVIARDSTEQSIGHEILVQLGSNPAVLWITSGIIGVIALIPGMPNFAFFVLSVALGIAAYLVGRQAQQPVVEEVAIAPEPVSSEDADVTWDDVAMVDVLGLEIGYRLIPLVDKEQGGELMSRIRGVRRKFSQELGFLIPSVHIRDNLDLAPAAYKLTLHGVEVGEGEVLPGREMAINPGTVYGHLDGVATVDPAYGLEALWIDPEQREQAQTLGFTVVDVGTVIATHFSRIIQDHAHELLGREEVTRLLEKLKEAAPSLGESMSSELMPQSVVHKVLRNLLEERVPIRDIRTIAEILAEVGQQSQDADALTAAVRVGLGRAIVQQLCGTHEEISVLTLEPQLERILLNSWGTAQGSGFLEPALAEQLRDGLATASEQQSLQGTTPVLLVPPEIRKAIANFVKHTVAGLSVLAYSELPPQRQIKVVATVGGQ